MIAAIYARKSTDQVGAGDKSESVERQIAHVSLKRRRGDIMRDLEGLGK